MCGICRDEKHGFSHGRELDCKRTRVGSLAESALAAHKDPLEGRLVEHILQRRLSDYIRESNDIFKINGKQFNGTAQSQWYGMCMSRLNRYYND